MTDELKMKVFMLFIDREIEALQEKVTQEKRIEIFLSRITNHKKFYTEWNSLISSDIQIEKTVSSYGTPKVVFLEEDLARVKFEKEDEIEFYFTKNNGNWCGANTSVEPRLWDIEFE